MGKTIAVSNIPVELKEELIANGYEVVDHTYEGYVDTILYNSVDSSIGYLNMFDNVIDMSSGAFIVDVNNKTVNEVINTIENRRYTSFM